MWSSSCLLVSCFLSQTCENLYKEGRGRDALDNCSSPFWWSSESITEQFLNYFIPRKFSLVVSKLCVGSSSSSSVVWRWELEPVQCISTVTLWRVNPSLQVFGIGIPLLCLNCLLFFILFLLRPHVMVCDTCVETGMQLQLHKTLHPPFQGTCVLDSQGVTSFLLDVGVFAVEAVAVFSFFLFFFSDCMVRRWNFSHSRPPRKPQTRSPSCDPLLLVTSSSPRGSPQCIAFKRYCTRQHLTAVQRNVCHAKRCFLDDISSHLCKRVCSCIWMLVWRNEEREKKKRNLRTPNCDHTTTITTSTTTTIQILQGLFCICVCRLSATFVRHGIVSISVF